MNPAHISLPSRSAQPAPARVELNDLDDLGDRIAELSAHIQAATYRLLILIREFDQRDGWNTHGARSCAHWLNWRTGLDLGAAREKVRVARALEHLPAIAAAMSRGEISYSKVRALTRVATPDNEAELLAFAKTGTASHVELLVRAWRRTDRLEECEQADRQRRHRYVQTYTDEDGMLVVRARLQPEAGALLLKALDAAQDQLYRAAEPREARSQANDQASAPASDEEEPEPEQKRADALTLVAESALAEGLDRAAASSRGDRYQVVVHVDAEALPEGSADGQSVLEGGVNVSAETSRRLSCDASKVVMRHANDGRVLDVGRKTRTVPPAIRRALSFRDRGCRFPGCGVRICDAHHVEHWADGGKTQLDNLVLLCRRHHTAVHHQGYRVLLRKDGSCTFYEPRGRPIPDAPPPPRLPKRPVAALRREHAARGLSIDPETAFPTWEGERFDLGLALEGYRGAANQLVS